MVEVWAVCDADPHSMVWLQQQTTNLSSRGQWLAWPRDAAFKSISPSPFANLPVLRQGLESVEDLDLPFLARVNNFCRMQLQKAKMVPFPKQLQKLQQGPQLLDWAAHALWLLTQAPGLAVQQKASRAHLWCIWQHHNPLYLRSWVGLLVSCCMG